MKILSKNEEILINKIYDLIDKSLKENVITYTSFLTTEELNLLISKINEFYNYSFNEIKFIFSAGKNEDLSLLNSNDNDHKVLFIVPISFKNEEIHNFINKTINIGKITFKINEKYINKTLSHRDYLGSLLSLGIKREIIGDIFISSKNKLDGIFYFLNKEGIKNEIEMNLKNINRYDIKSIEFLNLNEFIDENDEFSPVFEIYDIYVSSNRLDNVIKEVFNLKNREIAKEFIEKDYVYISGVSNISSSYELKENDRVSVKEKGKFIYLGISKINKKDKLYLKVKKFK